MFLSTAFVSRSSDDIRGNSQVLSHIPTASITIYSQHVRSVTTHPSLTKTSTERQQRFSYWHRALQSI
jgi:hypothetical protein